MLRSVLHPLRKARLLSCRRGYVEISDLFGEEEPALTADNSKIVKGFQAYPTNRKIKGKYTCMWSKETNKTIFDVVKLLATAEKSVLKLPNIDNNVSLLKPLVPDRTKMRSTVSPHVTWLGHATCYMQTDGCHILTDPVWSERASPLSFIGPKRYMPVPIEIEDLKIDVVLLSHTHYDHLDMDSAKRIGNRALWLVPLGVGSILKAVGVTNVVEMDWWDSHLHLTPAGKNIEIMFLPTKHWTSRTPFDRNTCLWGGFAVLGQQAKLFFNGDTAYSPHYKVIGDNLGPFDFAAIPIGAYTPRWFMRSVHCNPEEALRIAADLRAKQAIGVHWGTFPLTEEDPVEPALELARMRDVNNVPASSFFTMAHGETIILGDEPKHDFASSHGDLYAHFLKQMGQSIQQGSSYHLENYSRKSAELPASGTPP